MGNSIRVSNKILKLVGQNLYTSSPIFSITVRELLQNSYDAQKACGETAPISFNITRHSDDSISFSCKDKGIGMDEATIVDKFLVLGESGKEDGVGGFGVAKAAIILACDDWELYTRDNYLHGTADTVKVPERVGCDVNLRYTDRQNNRTFPNYYSCADALSYLATSATHSTVSFVNNLVDGDVTNTQLEFSGLFVNKKNLLEELDLGSNCIKIHCVPVIKFNSPWMYNRYDTNEEVVIQDKVIYRLNGLTQFIRYGSSSSRTGINLVVDITTSARPDSDSYPFSLSREEINSSLRETLSDKLRSYFANHLTTTKKVKEKSGEKKVYRQYYGGGLHSGRAQEKLDNKAQEDVEVGEEISSQITESVVERLMTARTNVDEVETSAVDLLARSPLGIKTLIRRAEKTLKVKANSSKYLKLLRAWTELIALIMTTSPIYQHSFGVGLILDKDYHAMREEACDGVVYYLVNPAGISTGDSLNAVMKMFFNACHEVTHTRNRDHGESFTVAEHNLVDRFFELYGVKKLQEIARFYRSGRI